MNWIHQTVTNLAGYQEKYSCYPEIVLSQAQLAASRVGHSLKSVVGVSPHLKTTPMVQTQDRYSIG